MRLILTVLLTLCILPARAQTLTASDIEAFLDGVMPLQLQREDIAGAVIVVVKDGQVLFAKGYGYSDVEKRTPVTPDATLFRPGSISKLFTWTSVMQLVEQNKLDLDRDVNDYLDFKIPATFPQPITLRNIMTHTPGFEEAIKDLIIADQNKVVPLDVYLKEKMPERVFPPGTTPAYSNYATTIAGYIVQRVSGEPFNDYVEHHILKPLGMNRTTFRQPLPADLEPLMSKGYQVASKPAKGYEYVQAWPAGSVATAATDMAKFMIMHLQDGHYGDVQILKPETARLMHSAQFVAVPPLNSMALGFYEESRNGQRIIGHGGDTVYFHSDLHLVLAANLGFFISYNSPGKGQIDARGAVWHKFLDRYFPYNIPGKPSPATAAEDARAVAGSYLTSRRPQTNIMSFITAAEITKVTVNPDNTISWGERNLNGEPMHFEEIAPMVFRAVHGQEMVAFKKDSAGHLVMGVDYPFMVFIQAPWYESSAFNNVLIFGALGVLLLTVILWPVAAVVRWHYGRPLKDESPGRRVLVRIVCLLYVAFAAAWIGVLSLLGDLGKLSESLDPTLRAVQILGWLGVIGTIIVLYDAASALFDRNRWWFSRLHSIAMAIACLGLAWFIYHWHMLHFSLKY